MRIAVAALILAGCVAAPAPAPAPAPAAAAATSTELARTATTVTGGPIALPPGRFELVVSATELPAGGVLPMHKHPWPRYFYVERGRIEVRYEASGERRVFGPGEAGVDPIDEWHEGRVVGEEGARLILFDQAPPGEVNVVRR